MLQASCAHGLSSNNLSTHVSPLWGVQKYRLGAGQQAEVKHMNERGMRYKLFALGTGFTGTAFTGDALLRAASDGPIALDEQPRPCAHGAP